MNTIKIITVNLNQRVLEIIDTLTGKSGLYPSRSELIRVAVRDWLVSELKDLDAFRKYQQRKDKSTLSIKTIDESQFVQVPISETEFKTYTLIQRGNQ